ncbi:OPT oligopeptide transporter [Auriculariales sp. MPI-PUGE-AT-0066]|nr:OPT oligopeptide transporter [Auriculariales sp. MPI-PUGE-AT-0066]
MPTDDRDRDRDRESSKDRHTADTLSLSALSKNDDLEAPARSSTLAGGSREDVTDAYFDDPNLDPDQFDDFEDDSPYPEVRCSVSNTDDPDMPASTLRAWVIGLILAVVIPGVNQARRSAVRLLQLLIVAQFYYFRYPAVSVGSLFALLIAFPMGRIWEYLMPSIRLGCLDLNPGPFNIKEHVLIMVMASVGSGTAYATDIVAVQHHWYHQYWGFGYQWMIVQSTQLIGFSVGGLVRRYLVSPPSMIWPQNLVYCALFNTLHSQRYSSQSYNHGLTRERFFSYAFVASFLWYWVPGYLFTGLSHMDWVAWIAPTNKIVNHMFGYSHGLGMSLISLDWAQIAYLGSPLATPWWAELNVLSGFVFFYWFLTPILYYSNVWNSAYMPISSRVSYDKFGNHYDIDRILNAEKTINMTAYEQYSPIFLPMTFAISYGLSFASITSTIVHAWIYYRKQILYQSKRGLKEQPDIHARLMSRYAEVPNWWYGCIFASMFVFGCVAISLWPTQMPIWTFVIALVIAGAYILPIGMLQALTNTQVPLNVITELVIGYMLPGKPVAMMLFKTYGYITAAQALTFARDLKLGHYMKIPPRSMFFAQVVATIVAGTAQLGVQSWLFHSIKNICEETQSNGFVCPSTQTFATASFIWGVIGPKLSYSKGGIYYGLVFFFLVGALAPVLQWLWTKRYPRHRLVRLINFPIVFSGTNYFPPALAVNYVTWGLVGFIFQYIVRRRRFQWWAHYNYILSAALDSGVAVATIIIFFALQYPDIKSTLDTWWGNKVWQKTYDFKGTSWRKIPQEGFGPDTW